VFLNLHTALGRALHLTLGLLWPRLRADLHVPRQVPLPAQVQHRMALALARLPWLLRRLDRLALLWQQNRLPKPRPRRARPQAQPQPPRLRDPSAQGWLSRIHLPARQFAGQIATLLEGEDARALTAAAPQAGRLLRPLCRMLGITQPDWLKLPPRPRKPRPPRPPRPRPIPLTDPSLGLQPYVIAAVRAARKKST
jgi:hypothetical protein